MSAPVVERLGATDELAARAIGLQWSDLDPRTRQETVRHVLDTVGVMVAGASGDVARRAARALAAAGVGTAGTPIPGRSESYDLLQAAYLGGTAAHGMELDDGYREGTTHPGACVVPAALAVAHREGSDGPALLAAVAAGYEAVVAVARACHPQLRRRGFHPTGASGVFGAAVAAARLLDLDAAATSAALGLAASSAGGLFAFLAGGADVKRLHAGNAARDGVLAALLAAEGVEGPPSVIEGPDGFAQAFADGMTRPFEVAPDGRWGIADCYFKPYPCCRHLQPAAEATFAVRAEAGVRADEIERIEVETYAIAADHAHTGWGDFASAQLSFPYIMALAARDGAITLRSFDEKTRGDAELTRLAGLVQVAVDPVLDAAYPARRPARVTIVTGRGRFTSEAMEALGSDEVPLDDAGLDEKFRGLVDPVLGTPRSVALLDALRHLPERGDVRGVLGLTTPR